MAVPYHTHTFEIPTATKDDVIAGVATDKAVTPSSLGSSAAKNVEDYATAEQGRRADSAVQPGDLAKVATTGEYGDLKDRPALGSAASHAETDFATAQQGSVADTALQPGDVGSAAAHDAGDFATAAQGAKADTAVQAPGGAAGQVLAKSSAADNDVAWQNVSAASAVSYGPQTLTPAQQGQARTNIGAGTTVWNWVINGDFSVNQRVAVSKLLGVGVYGYDRWFGASPSVGQIVENLPAGTYTMLWSGGGTGSVAAQSGESPIIGTIQAGDTVLKVPSTATNVMLLAGDWSMVDPTLAWSLCQRHPQQELALCQRYYCRVPASPRFMAAAAYQYFNYGVYWPVVMRDSPTMSVTTSYNQPYNGKVRAYDSNPAGTYLELMSNAAGDTSSTRSTVIADAEMKPPAQVAEIADACYLEDGSIVAVIDNVSLFIPDQQSNRHREMLASWEEDGNIIEPYSPPPVPIPDRVSRRRFRLQLEAAKLLEKADAWVATQDRSTQIAYEDSDGFNRNEPKLQEAFAAVGYSSSQIDDFFVEANKR